MRHFESNVCPFVLRSTVHLPIVTKQEMKTGYKYRMSLSDEATILNDILYQI